MGLLHASLFKRHIEWSMRFSLSFAVLVMLFVTGIKLYKWYQILTFLPRN